MKVSARAKRDMDAHNKIVEHGKAIANILGLSSSLTKNLHPLHRDQETRIMLQREALAEFLGKIVVKMQEKPGDSDDIARAKARTTRRSSKG